MYKYADSQGWCDKDYSRYVKIKRDKVALSEYLNSDRRPGYSADELYMLDIMRQGEKPDDPRL
jgi:hypothetical protein